MALTTIAGVNAALPGQRWSWQKTTPTLTGSQWYSSWTVAGLPGQGVAPSSGLAGDVPTKSTIGAFNFVNPASGNTYLARISVSGFVLFAPGSSIISLYDRLWHNSGISSTSTSGQTINSVAQTRPDSLGASAEAWYEVYVVMGSGTPTVTLAYTSDVGTVRTTGSTGVLGTAMPLGRTGRFQLVSGDVGVRSIQTWTSSATFTSGTIGLVLRRLVTFVSLPNTGLANEYDSLAVGLPRIYDNACLEMVLLPSSTNVFVGGITFPLVQG